RSRSRIRRPPARPSDHPLDGRCRLAGGRIPSPAVAEVGGSQSGNSAEAGPRGRRLVITFAVLTAVALLSAAGLRMLVGDGSSGAQADAPADSRAHTQQHSG